MKKLTTASRDVFSPANISTDDCMDIALSKEGDNFVLEMYKKQNPSSRIRHWLSYVERCGQDAETEEHKEVLRDLYRTVRYDPWPASRDAVEKAIKVLDGHANASYWLKPVLNSMSADPTRGMPTSTATQFLTRFPERQQLSSPTFKWNVSATDITAALINECWPADQISFSDDAKIAYEYLLFENKKSDLNALHYAKFRESGDVPQHSYDMHPDLELSGYQQVALVNSSASDGFGLFMDPGTGKTAICIARMCNMAKNSENPLRVAVVCPKNVRMNWQAEIERFATVKGKTTVLRGGALKRRKQCIDAFRLEDDDKFTVIIMGYETLCESWDTLQIIPFDLAVADESHYFKNPRTRRFEFMMKLRDNSAHRMPLTGTPVTNHALDLFAHFEFMGKGKSGFYNWKTFKNFYGVFRKGEGGHEILESVQNMDFMKERLARHSFQIKLREALPDLPEKLYDVHEVEMTKKQAETYEQVKTQLALEIENELESGRPKTMIIQNVLVKFLRLEQITSGFVVFDPVVDDEGTVVVPKSEEDIDEMTPKIEALLEIAKEKEKTDKTIVWACFQHDIKAIKKALIDAGEVAVDYYGGTSDAAREDAEYRFNCDPECRWLVGNPAAGGTGLNLLGYDIKDLSDDPAAKESNCNHIIYYSQDWSPVKREQSEARGARRGQRVPVRITDLCIPSTIDEEIRARVLNKRMNALEMTDVQDILNAVLGTTL